MSGPFGSSQMFTVASDYSIDHSLMFHDTDSLTLTPGTAGNRKTFTYSAWVKRTKFAASMMLFGAGSNSGTNDYMMFQGNDHIAISYATEGSGNLVTDAKYRDPSAWYHLVWAQDTNQSTAANRVKIYVNGVLQTLQTTSYPAEDYEGSISNTVAHKIGGRAYDAASFFDGYMTEINFIDGLALDPTYFGETGDYGEWKPKQQSYVFGDEGFWLRFNHKATGSGAVGRQGEDSSGNDNHWATSNTIQDNQMESESPTNNFPTYNPLAAPGSVFQEGNRTLQTSGNVVESGVGTMAIPLTGKWYWECYPRTLGGTQQYGIVPASHFFAADADYPSNDGVNGYAYLNTGQKSNNDSAANYGNSFTTGDIIGVAYDADNRLLYFYKNNTIQNSGTAAYTVAVVIGGYIPAVGTYGNGAIAKFNFGQDSSFDGVATGQNNPDGNGIGDFTYTPPSGYLALCAKNLPEPAVIPSEYFNSVLYTGDGVAIGSGGQAVTGVGFQPDLLIGKARSDGNSSAVYDAVRGVTKEINITGTAAEDDRAEGVTAFGADGFTVGSHDKFNRSGTSMVAWSWKANGSGASNTDGSINTTKTSANVDAGFSIMKWVGTGANATIGHGLSKAPEIVIVKNLSDGSYWIVGSDFLSSWAKYLAWNRAEAEVTEASQFNSTAPTSTLISLGSHGDANGSTHNIVAYAWHSVDGFCKVGSYTGNDAVDGNFINTGFRPAWVMIKYISGTAGGNLNWHVYDNKRSVFNPTENVSFINLATGGTETGDSAFDIDFLSNGFKLRNAEGPVNNAVPYIFLAFAETPFKYSNAK
jgi:hypothetical protein